MLKKLAVIIPGLFLLAFQSCKSSTDTKPKPQQSDTLTEVQKHLPENALKGLAMYDGLEVTIMATEPMLKNPTNMDVDERGRIWITEAYNYRPEINGNPVNEKGDRIMILEDTNGDGRSDTGKVFYQGAEMNAPLGICVLGNRVLVSQSPYVWAFYDDNNDDKADRKEVLFQGIGGEQHDHGMHTFTFGPDGKLYFNFGNEGKTLKDKNGKVVLDQDGEEIGPGKYTMGMVFRCNPDGTEVECLGQNFRNNYELAVDSYGGMWQSDNDDDGNKGVRINYMMDYGNYGYTDEMTKAGWQATRTNMEDSVPFRHWHLNDPGVVPNLLQTGAGSPTGMVIYEGNLLPATFQNQMIHADPGPNVIRSYPVTKEGAGYTAEIVNILKGENDQWFRPADICVAPDGSLIVADWYDPGVGGHQAGDQQKGRLYRIAPKGSVYAVPKQDYTTAEGAVAALQSPNLSVRHHAFTVLQQMGEKAIPALEQVWQSSTNQRMRARAFWVLVKMPNGEKYIPIALADKNPDIRITGIRAARQLKNNLIKVISSVVNDTDAQVRRELAIAIRHSKSPEAPALWANLANKHDGQDRWYLEALGIAADRQWNSFFPAYLAIVKDPLQTAGGRDIVWRARTDIAVPYLAKLAADTNTVLSQKLRYFRAFDFNEGPAKSPLLLAMLESNKGKDLSFSQLVLNHLDAKTVKQSAVARESVAAVLKSVAGSEAYIDLVRRYELKAENNNLLELAISKKDEQLGRKAATLLLQQQGISLINKVIAAKDSSRALALLQALGRVGSAASINILEKVVLSGNHNNAIKQQAARSLGGSMSGEDRVLELLTAKKVPETLKAPIIDGLKGAWRKAIYTRATSFLPGGTVIAKTSTEPVMADLAAYITNGSNGKKVFGRSCAVCHQVNAEGYDFGPKLSEIGSKLPVESLLEALVHPSKGISFGFETKQLKMKDGSTLTGIISSKTETDIDLKFPGGAFQKLKTSDVQSVKELPESMMPANLHETMTKQELADMLAYLSGLKKK
ncbi:MAG: PVC-type heme-binding CxxCH protein [Bacteroidota bacterium]